MQHCAIFCNQKNAKRREPTNTGAGTGIQGYGKREVFTPLPPLVSVASLRQPREFLLPMDGMLVRRRVTPSSMLPVPITPGEVRLLSEVITKLSKSNFERITSLS